MVSGRIWVGVATLALGIVGCASDGPLGVRKNSPDEFSIVTNAPLTLPPDYSLRPPRPGETRPDRLSTSARTQQLLLGNSTENPPSSGELALLQVVGALDVDQNIRAILAAENGGRAEKEASFSNQIIFWNVDEDGNIDDGDAPLVVDNPDEWKASRKAAIETVTGGQTVEISKSDRRVLNLPGVK